MSDTPERIWHQHDGKGHLADLAELAVKPVDEVQTAFTEYLRADIAAAQVAAAYERAADLCVDQFQAHLDLVITGNPDNARNRESAANMAEKLSHEIRALATDTQTDALEQVRKEADRAGYERGVREAANVDSNLEDLNFDGVWTLYEHGVHDMQEAIMALIKPTAQEDDA